jgi:acetylornithine deacetylase/succinyl-diaminopimelate desuccinylase-like protein
MEHAIVLLERMISIPSSNPHTSDVNETEIAVFLRSELEANGFQVEFQPVTSSLYDRSGRLRQFTRSNVIARTGEGGGTKLILNGHLDTVSGSNMNHPFDPQKSGGRLYGRGSSDMKGGLAAIVSAAEAIVASKANHNGVLVLCLVVDEEAEGEGTKKFLKNERGDFAIVAEPTENKLGIAQAGYLEFNVKSKGESRHGQTALPHTPVSAFVRATEVCGRILEDSQIMRKKTYRGLVMPATFNFSPGAFAPPPSNSWMTMDEFEANCLLGLIPETTIKKSEKAADRTLNRVKRVVESANERGQMNMFDMVDMNIGFIQSENPYTERLRTAMNKVSGTHQHIYFLSFSDATYFYRENIPTVIFGPGKLELAHSSHEYILVRQVKQATAVLANAVEDILNYQ